MPQVPVAARPHRRRGRAFPVGSGSVGPGSVGPGSVGSVGGVQHMRRIAQVRRLPL